MQHRDEMAGWIGSFTRYKGQAGGSDEANWLTLHRGGQLSYDRKTGTHTTVWVPNACVSVCGGIQPYKLAELMHRGLRESGLAARVLFAMPPKTRKEFVEDDIPQPLKDAAARSLDALYALQAEPVGDGRTRPFLIPPSPEARDRWKAFVNEWGHKTFEAEGDRAAAFAKLESYAARLALVHHLAETASEGRDRCPVSLKSVEAGITLAGWFAGESERVYAMLAEPEDGRDLRRLAELAERLASKRGGVLEARDLQQHNSRKYRSADEAEAALRSLVDAGAGVWVARPDAPNGQARKPVYRPTPTSYVSDTPDGPDGGNGDGGDAGPSYTCPDTPDTPPGGCPPEANVNPLRRR